ncbi:hypothetical protein CHLRE_02g111800v5 [Chlamydomonas reinhardtii]|uniref:Uncharacterized protein n=1 Tax=Chlamydomonas reinhardtii TaxID=3055 RepID=A0A2K3E312_CHLRE|nr:uncharacterized protein CHLRE_02g111800v5 [Chlamydomonas reinhardtii]PNW87172.1 hypothetical protein CHLRE_02g111800v5 [Chlamydomonas reinhardtii]
MMSLRYQSACQYTVAGRGRRAVVPVRAVSEAPAGDTAVASTSAPAGQAFRNGTAPRRMQSAQGPARRSRGGSQGDQQQADVAGAARRGASRATSKERWPGVAFLDDDAGAAESSARALFRRHMASAEAAGNIVVRSLGRSGALGAVRFLTALRREGQAAEPPVDVRVRVLKQEPISGGFGAPLLMFVERVAAGADQLPEVTVPAANGSEPQQARVAPEGPLQASLLVSRASDPERLERALYSVVNGLQPGQFVAVNMVGSATLLLGLQSLVNARTSMGARGRDIYFVPTVTSQPLRQSSTPAPAAASSTPATDGEQPAAEVKAPAADAAAATSDPQMVEVVRLFVGVSRPAQPRRDAAARASAPAPAASEAAQPSPSVGSEQVPEAPAAQAQPQQVTVPLSELESLRSALSTMMQQQQQLEALLRDRQQRQQPQASQQ